MIKDRIVCSKCCFCIPLRRGLLTWAYFKLIIVVLMLFHILTTYGLSLIGHIAEPHRRWSNMQKNEFAVVYVALFMLLIDIVFGSIFIIGAQRKELKLLKVCFIYNIVLWVLTVLLGVTWIGFAVYYLLSHELSGYLYFYASITFLYFVLQSYFVLLLRSEVIKRKYSFNIVNIQFVNNKTEPECTLNI